MKRRQLILAVVVDVPDDTPEADVHDSVVVFASWGGERTSRVVSTEVLELQDATGEQVVA